MHMHENHRERMKRRFLAEGLDSFDEHNVLEFLLFFSIPRKDTNEIAHTLINTFGSLAKVMDADIEELIKIPGISMHSAIFLKALPQIARRYLLSVRAEELPVCDTLEKLCRYAVDQYVGVTTEVTKLLLLDNSLRVTECVELNEGSVGRTEVGTRKIVETAIRRNAPLIVLMHNHPHGKPVPSDEDLETTLRLQSICEAMEIKLLEHILVASGTAVPILHPRKNAYEL